MATYIKWFELFATICAIVNYKTIKLNPFLKYLTLLLIFITFAEFAGYIFTFYKKNNTVFYNLLVEPFTFILYAVAFYFGFEQKKNKKFSYYGLMVVLLLYTITLLFVDLSRFLNVIGYNFGALFIGTLSILKISEIINSKNDIDYFREPIFYLLLAILFYYLITIPYFSISSYFYIHKIKSNATIFLKYVNTIFNYLLYTSFAINFILWGKKKQLH
jgi:hypothetical protein